MSDHLHNTIEMKAFQQKLEDCLSKLQTLSQLYSNKDGWIVESKNHVNVGANNGLNGTAFAVKSPLSCTCAIVWATEEEAEKQGMDYYLVDKNGKAIYTKVTKAADFFTSELEECNELLIFVKDRLNNKLNQ